MGQWRELEQEFESWRRSADAAAANGANVARVWLCSWFGHITPERIDEEHARLIDRVLAHARQRELRVILVFDNFYDLRKGSDPAWGTEWRQRIDTFFNANQSGRWRQRINYIISRWGCDDTIAAWELFNEVDLAFQPNEDHLSRLDQADKRAINWAWPAAAYLKGIDPDKRLITISTANAQWPQLFHHQAIDLVSVHDYLVPPSSDMIDGDMRDVIRRINNAYTPYRKLGKPILLAECGHKEVGNQIPGHTLDPQAIALDHWLWGGLLMGGCGSALPWWWDKWLDQEQLWPRLQAVQHVIAQVDWNELGLQPLPNVNGGQLELLGWHSHNQVLVWPHHRQDHWYRQAVEQAPAPRWKNTQVQLTGMSPDRHYSWQRWRLDGATLPDRSLNSDANGNIFLPVSQEDLRAIHLLQSE